MALLLSLPVYTMRLQSIRAGVIDAGDSYKFMIPESWSEQKIANILTGNFCMVTSLSWVWNTSCLDHTHA